MLLYNTHKQPNIRTMAERTINLANLRQKTQVGVQAVGTGSEQEVSQPLWGLDAMRVRTPTNQEQHLPVREPAVPPRSCCLNTDSANKKAAARSCNTAMVLQHAWQEPSVTKKKKTEHQHY
jgi:hypothetical protein